MVLQLSDAHLVKNSFHSNSFTSNVIFSEEKKRHKTILPKGSLVRIHDPRLGNMAHALSLSVFIALKGAIFSFDTFTGCMAVETLFKVFNYTEKLPKFDTQ